VGAFFDFMGFLEKSDIIGTNYVNLKYIKYRAVSTKILYKYGKCGIIYMDFTESYVILPIRFHSRKETK